MLVIIYNLIKNHDVYNEAKFDAAKLKQESMRLRKIVAEAKKFGFNLVQAETVA